MAGVARDDVALNRAAEQREVADQVEDLVPDELVAIAELVQHAALADDDRVVERAALRQAVPAQLIDVLQEAVGPGRRELPDERFFCRLARNHLGSDGRMGAVKRVADAERVAGEDLEPAGLGADADRPADDERLAPGAKRHAAGRAQQRDEGLGAAVGCRNFGSIHLDVEVVDAESRGRGHEMLDRLDARAVRAERGRVMGVDDARRQRRDRDRMADDVEQNPRVRAGRRDDDLRGPPRVKSDPFEGDLFLDRLLEGHLHVGV